MSDEASPRRQRSAINALKLVNQLREEKGLPRVSTKPRTIRITPELKKEITSQELGRLFPEALSETHFEFTEEHAKKLIREVELRLTRIRSGKEVAPQIEGGTAPRRRGRPPRA